MRGNEVLRRVRQQYSVTELPVIILAASSDKADINRSLELGANDYIINVNRFGAQFLGYSADEIVKCPVLDLYVADDRGLAQGKLANAVDMLGAVQR